MDRESWLKWRKLGIGSSDAAAIMGVSKWKTELQLYEEKIAPGIEEDNSNSYIKDKGNRVEPRVRARFELMTGLSFLPALVMNEEKQFLRSSLDGLSEDKKEILEIKLIGKADFEAVKAGLMLEKYFPQVQHALLVSKAECCHFVCFYDEHKTEIPTDSTVATLKILPDLEYQARLMAAYEMFWQKVQDRVSPSVTAADWTKLMGAADIAKKYIQIRSKIDILEKEMRPIQDELILKAEASGHKRLEISGLKITKVNGADWDLIV